MAIGISARGTDDLYLRAVSGNWSGSISEKYKMRLVKSGEGYDVYNWTGFFPDVFVIANESFDICLGSASPLLITGPSMQPAPSPVRLEPCAESDDTLMITTSGKTDRNAEDMLIVERHGNFWQAMIVNPAYFICVDEQTDEVFSTDMYGSFDVEELLYECVTDIIGPFKVLRGNGGTMYNRTTPSLFVELDKISDIDHNPYNSNSFIYPDAEEGYRNTLVQIRFNLSTYKSTILLTPHIEEPPTTSVTSTTTLDESWYTLQGERLKGPRPGLLIHVTPEGATKILYR